MVQILEFNGTFMVLCKTLLDNGKFYKEFDRIEDALAFRRTCE